MINKINKIITLSILDLKSRNHRNILGILWYLIQPISMFFILFYVKNSVLGVHINNFVPYLLIGVLMIHFFIHSTNLMMTSIINNYHLLESKKINPELFLITRFLVSIMIHLIESTVAIIILIYLGYWGSILYLLVFPIFALFVFSVGKVLCLITTKLFDFSYVWNYFCQIIWLITPVYFISNNEWITKYNPLVYYIDLARSFVYEEALSKGNLLLITILLSVSVFIFSYVVFEINKKYITERVR